MVSHLVKALPQGGALLGERGALHRQQGDVAGGSQLGDREVRHLLAEALHGPEVHGGLEAADLAVAGELRSAGALVLPLCRSAGQAPLLRLGFQRLGRKPGAVGGPPRGVLRLVARALALEGERRRGLLEGDAHAPRCLQVQIAAVVQRPVPLRNQGGMQRSPAENGSECRCRVVVCRLAVLPSKQCVAEGGWPTGARHEGGTPAAGAAGSVGP
mmetsp:Transcript_48477/g.97863  ORF Transcript_48477/g.97863 Transcript_48477/m.97863 type:complete len:214 (-) Transcript_48477:286-927(-)